MSSIWAAGEWVGTYRAADAAVGFRRSTAATVALIVHSHLQTVFEANGFDGEAVVSAAGRAAPRIHADVKWNLWRNGELSVIVNCATSLKKSPCWNCLSSHFSTARTLSSVELI